jgi:hypothetical protein
VCYCRCRWSESSIDRPSASPSAAERRRSRAKRSVLTIKEMLGPSPLYETMLTKRDTAPNVLHASSSAYSY